jgi:hypothetical protein
MGTTKEDLKRWFDAGKKEDATHLIVVCDTFDHEDYPVHVKKGEDVNERVSHYNGPNMQKVMEVYSYKKTWEEQSSGRVWNLD